MDQDKVELVPQIPPYPDHQQAAPSVLYTTSCKRSLVLLRMGEIVAWNLLSWLKLSKQLLLLHPVGWLYQCISNTRSHKHVTLQCEALTQKCLPHFHLLSRKLINVKSLPSANPRKQYQSREENSLFR
jgi:hypothetical protein